MIAQEMTNSTNFGGVCQNKKRDSNLELYRIIVMFAIVAHHYVVNSGLMTSINERNALAANSLFLLLFGCWGKIGINCFVLITGYFMCKSNITPRKFLKLFLEWMFYKYVIYAIFTLSGYQPFSVKDLIKTIIPFMSLTDGFTSCFIVFFLFIPFLNILIKNLNEKRHRCLLFLVLGVYSVLAMLPFTDIGSSYVFWFMALYFVASYIRIYPISLYENTKFWGWLSFVAVICSFVSIIFMAYMKENSGLYMGFYYFVADSNKITALAVSVAFFMFFKNIKVKYHPFINKVAASTFGVLLIHANSDTMRQWLWRDICNNVGFFDSPYLVLHAFGVVIVVFVVCIVIDWLRIRFIERPVFNWLGRFEWINKEIY